MVWDDSYWTVGLTTTTLATISDPTTENTVLGAPTITGTSLSDSTLTVSFDHAPAVKGLEIVAYPVVTIQYQMVQQEVDGFEVSSKTCVIDIPTNYPTVYVKVHAKYGNYINCGQANETCVQIDNAQWGPYTDWYAVTIFTPTTTTTPLLRLLFLISQVIIMIHLQVLLLLLLLRCLHQTQLLQR